MEALGRMRAAEQAPAVVALLKAPHPTVRRAAAQAAWRSPQTLPSARVLEAIQDKPGCAYTAFVRERSLQARTALLALPWSAEQQAAFEREALASHEARLAIEAADTVPFETFRQDYVSAKRLMPG